MQILDNHVDKIASSYSLSHVKTGKALEITEDGTANFKIVNSLESDDLESVA